MYYMFISSMWKENALSVGWYLFLRTSGVRKVIKPCGMQPSGRRCPSLRSVLVSPVMRPPFLCVYNLFICCLTVLSLPVRVSSRTKLVLFFLFLPVLTHFLCRRLILCVGQIRKTGHDANWKNISLFHAFSKLNVIFTVLKTDWWTNMVTSLTI